MNADATEFIPGSFVMPPFIPSVNQKLWIPSTSPLFTPTEMYGIISLDEGLGSAGMETTWDMSTLSTLLTPSEDSTKDDVAEDDTTNDHAEGRILKLASCLLRFLLEPPVLQTSELVKIIEDQLGDIHGSGPWCERDLRKVSFSCSDLALLDTRLAALLQRLPPEVLRRLPKQAKLNLTWDNTGTKWSFTNPPELRRLIRKQTSTSYFVKFAITSQRLSECAVEQLDQMRLKGGIACVHGLDSCKAEVAGNLTGKGYGTCCARGKHEATTIVWDRSLWTLCGSYQSGSFLAVDLKSKEQVVRVAGISPTLETCCDASFCDFLSGECSLPLVVCADLSLLGGTSSAGLVPMLLGLDSAMFEILGHEIAVPHSGADASPWQPSGIYFRSATPLAALSGYTEGYLARCLDSEKSNHRTSFPEGQATILAFFGVQPEYK